MLPELNQHREARGRAPEQDRPRDRAARTVPPNRSGGAPGTRGLSGGNLPGRGRRARESNLLGSTARVNRSGFTRAIDSGAAAFTALSRQRLLNRTTLQVSPMAVHGSAIAIRSTEPIKGKLSKRAESFQLWLLVHMASYSS